MIIPKGRYRKSKYENIQVKFYVDNQFNLLDRIMDLEDILTPPFRIQIDCGILLQRGFEEGKFNTSVPVLTLTSYLTRWFLFRQ